MPLRKHIGPLTIYVPCVLVAFCLAALHSGAQTGQVAVAAGPSGTAKPYFSLSTNRTYGTSDRARVWISYVGLDRLDFRVYRVKEPMAFFKQLNDPHQMGEQEKSAVAAAHQQKPSFAEKLRTFKSSVYKSIKGYFRNQLRHESRAAFNQKFRGEGSRLPLNVADYSRVPLLNPDQLVSSWREMLPRLENEYDWRMISLGQREPGVYLVEAVNGDLRAYTIAVITDLTMVTKTSQDGGTLVYVVDRKSGAPQEGVHVEIVKGKKAISKGTTNQSGILKSHIERRRPEQPADQAIEDIDSESEPSQVGRNAYLVIAGGRDHFAISDLEPYYFGGTMDEGEEWQGQNASRLTAYIYTDRPIYRPRQKVYFKGILRRLTEAGYALVSGGRVSVTVEDPKNGKLFEKDLSLSPRGSFNGEVEIGDGAALGGYRIVARVGNATASGYFEVQEYKKPEYKVVVAAEKKFVPVGERVKFSIEARYFFGSPVANAEVKYYIYRSRYYQWWWRDETEADLGEPEESYGEADYYGYGNDLVKDGLDKLDTNGRLDLEFEVPPANEKESWDYTYRLEAQVTDASRRAIEGKASIIGTRGSIIAYAQPQRFVYYQGDSARIQIKTADYEGRPVAARVTLKFVQQRWERVEKPSQYNYRYYDYQLHEQELQSAEVSTNSQGIASYDYLVPVIGSLEIKTIVHEGGKEFVSNTGYLWVADRQNKWLDFAYQDYGAIKLIPDKNSYQPGETAHVLATLPVDKAHLLVTTELTRVMTVRQLDAVGRALMIDVPIEPSYAPNVYLSVTCVKDGEMYLHDRALAVPARDKFLSLEILANKQEYKPRETASYTILARNPDGSPAPAVELSLGVVDEAIYSVRAESARDIRKAFYGHRYNQVQTRFSVSYRFSGHSGEKPVQLSRSKATYQLADFKNESQYAQPMIRKEFKDTAHWQPEVVTGTDGKATVNLKLPDNLTTWRATARAVTADTRVGSSLAKVLARKDLILRLETPRFLTEGDAVTVSGIVHNYLDSDKSTQISIEVSGAQLIDPATQTVTIASRGEHRVNWRLAAPGIGTLKLLAKALTDAESDAVEMELEIVPGGLRQTRGETTTLSEDSTEKTLSLDLPAQANARARSLRIEVSPSIAGTLFGALDYLTSYPYGCTEQTMSSFLPNVIVAQALKEVKTATLRASNNLDKKVNRGLDRLYSFQHGDGGWGWWKEDRSDPFMTAYVVNGLWMASGAGYSVETNRINLGRNKLKQMMDAGKGDDGRPIDMETRAYMIHALHVSGGTEADYVNNLFNKRGELQPYGQALLALTLKASGNESRAREVADEIERSAKGNEFAAHWESRRRPMLDFTEENDTEATALSLKALAQIAPQSAIMPKVARWLVSNRPQGYCWYSTKDTAFAIFGLTDYLKVSQELSPDYNVELYLNGEQVLTRRLSAADAVTAQTFFIQRKGTEINNSNQVRVVKRGRGTLYLSTAVEYFVKETEIAGQASELKLTREYLRLRVVDGGGKLEWKVEPLTGELHSGDLLLSRLHLQGSRGRYVMIEDPIPAGCEQIEQVSGINLNYTEGRWSDWYSEREFRDQKTALFVEYFMGNSTFQYALRVQVPGEFRAAPARAQLMYQPTVQASTPSSNLKVWDKR